MTNFDHKEIEAKWSKIWDDTNLYKTPELTGQKKMYILDMFPYPSGAGLHVGHIEGYTGTDVMARYYRMKGYAVLHPMGWDAFGLPAENYAIKNGLHPAISTADNIQNFIKYLRATGLSYDWDREIDSSKQDYYKWTQWIFIQLFKAGLAYKKKAPANWCPSCETVLANEQVIDGKCERCETAVQRKDLDQWFFKITDYADRLIDGLDKIDWPKSTIAMQKNWIGKAKGWKIKFDDIEVFTTRPDTLHGATFIAVSAEYPGLKEQSELADFIKSVEVQGYKADKNKRGMFTGKSVTNPATGKQIPVWVSNYVSVQYGTGAIMGVPAHDERDMEFAKKYGLEIIQMNPDEKMKKYALEATTYHLHDWLVSRQRYWGAPIPMTNCQKCGWQPIPEDQLPVLLPTDVEFTPKGMSPLAKSKSFQENVSCSKCGSPAVREVDTMDTFVDSSWYFLRFCDAHNSTMAFDQKIVQQWAPVDLYVGGAEHTVLHLMYSRFFYKAFCDLSILKSNGIDEPFLKLRHQGTVLGPDNRKMSKRWGNVVGLDEVVNKFGADTVRMYELFMGPFEDMKSWQTNGVEGLYRFLGRLYRKFESSHTEIGNGDSINRLVNQLVSKISEDIENMSFNTAIAAMMETFNSMSDADGNWKSAWEKFILVLAPFAPFLAEEMWHEMGHADSVHSQSWPIYDLTLVSDKKVTIVVQIDGKVRERLEDGPDIQQRALASAKVQSYLKGASYRAVFVPGKVINFVTK